MVERDTELGREKGGAPPWGRRAEEREAQTVLWGAKGERGARSGGTGQSGSSHEDGEASGVKGLHREFRRGWQAGLEQGLPVGAVSQTL